MPTISKPILFGGGAAFVAVVAFLAFGVFGVQTLFIDDEVDEANPFATTSEAVASEPESATAEPVTDDATDADVEEAATAPPSTAPPAGEATSDAETEIVTLTSGPFVANDHPTVGTGFTITDGEQTFLRFEDFETDNGPDLNVYLRNSADPDDYIDLGDLKGNIGDQNYELPDGIDLGRYDLVDIWCVRFGVSFGSAQLA